MNDNTYWKLFLVSYYNGRLKASTMFYKRLSDDYEIKTWEELYNEEK